MDVPSGYAPVDVTYDGEHIWIANYFNPNIGEIDGNGSEEPNSPTTTTSDNPHYVLLSPAHDPQAAIVCLYGFKFRVEIGSQGELPAPVVMICEIDGSGIRRASPHEIKEIIESIIGITFTQPWKRPPEVAYDPTTRLGCSKRNH